MEFRGLESHIENYCKDVIRDVNIREKAASYKGENEHREPILLIDVNSCSDWLYNTIEFPGAHFGMYQEFKRRCQQFIDVFQDSSFRTVFIIDGFPTNRKEHTRWKNRNILKKRTLQKAKMGYGRNPIPLENTATFCKLDIAKAAFFIYLLRVRDCEIMQPINGVYNEILTFIARNGCFGILAQATRYIAIDNIENFFSVNHLNVDTLDTKKYCRKTLAKHLDINESFLPLLASLCGNELISDSNLYKFHLSLFPEYGVTRKINFWAKRPTPLARIAHWIKVHSDKLTTNPTTWITQTRELIGLRKLNQKIASSIKYYFMCSTDGDSIVNGEDSEDDNSKVLRLAEKRHRNEGLHGSILSVISEQNNHNLFYYRDCFTPRHPSVAEFLAPLRKRLYGILLDASYSVEECVQSYYDPLPDDDFQVDFVGPDNHPGVLKLWGNGTDEERMRMLCWAISDNLKLEDLLTIPKELRIASLALFYIAENGSGCCPRGRRCPHIEAVAAVIAKLYQKPLLNPKTHPYNLVADPIDMRSGFLFTQTWFQVLTVHDACGSPLLGENNKVNSVFFDEKLYNILYKQLFSKQLNEYPFNIDDKNVYECIINFLPRPM